MITITDHEHVFSPLNIISLHSVFPISTEMQLTSTVPYPVNLFIYLSVYFIVYLFVCQWFYNTLFEPILSFTDTARGELSSASSKRFQWLQNRAACIIQRRDYYRDRLRILGRFDLKTNRKINKCILVLKRLHGLAAGDDDAGENVRKTIVLISKTLAVHVRYNLW